jgi:hypothetical protein
MLLLDKRILAREHQSFNFANVVGRIPAISGEGNSFEARFALFTCNPDMFVGLRPPGGQLDAAKPVFMLLS